jgi:hypothetical protein
VKGTTTQALMDERLESLRQEPRFDPADIRLSEAAHCPRRQTLRILGYEAEAPTLDQQGIFDLGHEHEERMADLWRERYGADAVLREVEVKTPFGTGHIDALVVPAKHLVEFKTTKASNVPYLPLEEHVAQVTLYLHYHVLPLWGDEATAEIAYRVKETGRVLSFPVRYDPELAARLVEGLQAVQDAVDFGIPLPVPRGYFLDQFPCGWWNDAGEFQTCAFWRHCWSVQPGEEDEQLAALLVRLREAEEGYRRASGELDRAKQARDAARAAVGRVMDEAGQNTLRAGGIEAVSIRASGWTTWDVRAAIEAGVVTREAMRPFERTRAGNETWKVRDLAEIATRSRKGA